MYDIYAFMACIGAILWQNGVDYWRLLFFFSTVDASLLLLIPEGERSRASSNGAYEDIDGYYMECHERNAFMSVEEYSFLWLFI